MSGGNAPRSRSAELRHRVAARGADQQHEERQPFRLVEPAGDAEVHQHRAPVGLHHEIAAVQVAVEDAEEHGAFHERDEACVQHRFGVDAGVLHRRDVVPRDAVESLHHEHAPRDQRRMRPGHDGRALVGLGEHAGDVEHVLRLEAEVELLDDRLCEQLDERGRVRERGDGDSPDQARRDPRHRANVFTHHARHLRALHFDDDLFARSQSGAVHLRDRRRRDWSSIESLEHVVEGTAEVELHDPPHDFERLGWNAVAKQLELAHQLFGEQSFAARDDLAELDVGRPQGGEGVPEPSGQPASPRRSALPAIERVPTGERDTDASDDAGDAADRRQRAGLQPGGELIAGLRAPAIDVGAPTHGVGVDDPRPMIAERPDREITRAVGLVHV